MKTLRREIIERSEEVKKRRKKINWILFIVILVLFFVLIVLTFNHPRLAHSRITLLDSTSKLNKQEILTLVGEELSGKYFYFFNKNNYYFYPKAELEKILLDKFPRIKKLEFSGKNNILTITTISREPKYMWCHEAEDFCQYLDGEGVAFGLATKI